MQELFQWYQLSSTGIVGEIFGLLDQLKSLADGVDTLLGLL